LNKKKNDVFFFILKFFFRKKRKCYISPNDLILDILCSSGMAALPSGYAQDGI